MLEPDHDRISLRRQCDLLGLNRATAYYRRRVPASVNSEAATIHQGLRDVRETYRAAGVAAYAVRLTAYPSGT